MLGTIYKYDKINEIGYILGYDEITYFYHQSNVIKNEVLKEGDIVDFDYLFEKNQDQLPYAINIAKEKIRFEDEEKEKKEKYNVDVFAKKNKTIENNNIKNVALIEIEKETWVKKFINFIKKVFR